MFKRSRSPFDNLLGWKDFGEALFAQTQRLDAVQKYASYSTAIQGKLAELESGLNTVRIGAATNGVIMTPPADVVLTADYRGVITPAAQLPKNITFTLALLGSSILSDPRTAISYVLDGVTGAQTAPGTFQVTAMTKLIGRVTIHVVFAGVDQGDWVVKLSLAKDPVPVASPPSGDTPPAPGAPVTATGRSTFALSSVTDTTSFQLLAAFPVTGGFSYRTFLNSVVVPAETREGTGQADVYIAIRPAGGSWVQQGAVVTCAPALIFQSNYTEDYTSGHVRYTTLETTPGSIAISRDIVLPSGAYEIGYFGKLLYTLPVNFSDPAVAEAI